MISKYVFNVLENAVSSSTANEVMRCFAESSYEDFQISTIKYFRVNSENKIELISAYGAMFALLENFKYISRDRKLPISDVVNLGSELYISSPEQLMEMYDEAKYWRNLPAAILIIPVKKLGVTWGCVSVTMDQPLESTKFIEAAETLRVFAYLLELLLVHELSGIPTLIGLNGWTTSPQEFLRQKKVEGEEGQKARIENMRQVSANLELSDRQYQIAILIASGATNADIARKLGFSAATIRYETVKLYERLRVKNRSQASSRIREMGIV
jgi:DNA-binding CsgD family transcriptional regulator